MTVCLLQANDGNVEIGGGCGDVNAATMKVLSRQQCYENLHSYQAPSLRRNETLQ